MKKFLLLLVLSTALTSHAFAAMQVYMTVKGAKQGAFKGESAKTARKDSVEVLSFAYDASVPVDPATGLASGKRQHSPVVITKEWGAASPQLFQSLVTNEVLPSVVISFYETSPTGVEALSSTITLTNAAVLGIKQYSRPTDPTLHDTSFENLQDVSFSFQKITITDKSGTTAEDDWNIRPMAE